MKLKRFELALLLLAAAAVLFTAGFLIGRSTGRVRIYVTGSSAAPEAHSPAPEEPDASYTAALSGAGDAMRTSLTGVREKTGARPNAVSPAARLSRTGTASKSRLGGRFP